MTHLKLETPNDFCSLQNAKKISLSKLHKHLCKTNFHPYFFWHDEWLEIEPRVCDLYTLHNDFRGYPINVGIKYIDFVNSVRDKISNDEFPFADRIKDSKELIDDFLPIILIYRDGNIVVFDSSQRTICACYHNKKTIKAYIFGIGE